MWNVGVELIAQVVFSSLRLLKNECDAICQTNKFIFALNPPAANVKLTGGEGGGWFLFLFLPARERKVNDVAVFECMIGQS